MVFNGEEDKAVEYAGVAGINVNSIAGEPLSVWFYRDGRSQTGRYELRNVAIQKIVFERFRQNPNLTVGSEGNNLSLYCSYAPVPQNFQLETNGTSDQIRALREQQDNARRPHIEAMASGFASLLRYGLKDKRIINDIFMGCFFRGAIPLTAANYDTILSPMLRAGANVNGEYVAGQRPIQDATEKLNAEIIGRLIRDGAQANFPVRHSAYDKPGPGDPCTPARARSLYFYVFKQARPRNTEQVVKVVAALAAGGLSPLTKYGYQMNDGSGRCGSSSFYDVVVDTGNLDFARQLKEITTKPAAPAQASPQTAAITTPPASGQTATPPTAKPADTSSWRAAVMPGPAGSRLKEVAKYGAWYAGTDLEGRVFATTGPANGSDTALSELRLECVSGRLEYVAVPAKNEQVRSFFVDGVDDMQNQLPLVGGRVTGKAAAQLSKEFLTAEANARKDGAQNEWTMGITINDANREPSRMNGAGFSQMRAYLLANCKN